MNLHFLHIISLLLAYFTNAQTCMKEAIIKNKVKLVTETHYWDTPESSCSVFIKTYDKQGNMIGWSMQRLGFRDEYVYDQQNRKIATIRISKSANSTRDTILRKTYDQYGNLTFDGYNVFQNIYDDKNRLIKRIPVANSYSKDTVYSTFKTYKYDIHDNLIKETHYKDAKIENTIFYEYDSSCKLIEKREYNKSSIESFNKEYAEYKQPIVYFLTNIRYNQKGKIKEMYEFYSDRCMSFEDHYTFKYYYKPNGLLDKKEVFFTGRHKFSIKYEYTYY